MMCHKDTYQQHKQCVYVCACVQVHNMFACVDVYLFVWMHVCLY